MGASAALAPVLALIDSHAHPVYGAARADDCLDLALRHDDAESAIEMAVFAEMRGFVKAGVGVGPDTLAVWLNQLERADEFDALEREQTERARGWLDELRGWLRDLGAALEHWRGYVVKGEAA
jgi:hypothetical protein